MNNNLLNKQMEIKKMINRVYDLSLKLSGNIKIKDLNSASNLVAIIHGYKSWKEYKLNNKDIYQDLNLENSIVVEKNNEKYIKKEFVSSVFDFNKYKKISQKKYINKENKGLPNGWLIAKKRHDIEKYIESKLLLNEDTVITSDKSKEQYNFYQKQIDFLLENKQSLIIFGNNIEDIKNNIDSFKIIGENRLKLNPLEDLLNSDGLELFFKIDELKDQGTFPWLWLMLIRTIQEMESNTFTVKDLLELTDLEKIINIYHSLKNNNYYIKKIIENYLFKKCQIIKNDKSYTINENSYKTHYEDSFLLIKKLNELNDLYNKNIFSYSPDISFSDIMNNKDNCYILENNEIYLEAISLSYIKNYKNYFNSLKNINNNSYYFWTLFWDAEKWISKLTASEYANQETSLIMYYINSNINNLSLILNKVNQLIMFKQTISGYTEYWKDKILYLTEYYNVNLWYGNKKILTELKENEIIFWSSSDKNSNIELKSYKLEKVELM